MTIDAAQEDRLDGQLRKAYKEGLSPNIAVSAGGLQLFKSAENEQRGNSMESIRHAFQEGTVYGSGDTPVSGSTLVEMDSGNTLLGEDHGDGVEVADRESSTSVTKLSLTELPYLKVRCCRSTPSMVSWQLS